MTSGPQTMPTGGGLPSQLYDLDPTETQEWLESLDEVVTMPVATERAT